MKKTLLTAIITASILTVHADTLTNGLTAFYPFDGSGIDASGNGRNLTIGNCAFTNGVKSSGLYYSVPAARSYAYYKGTPQTTTNFTYSVWINREVLTRTGGDMWLLGQGQNWVSSIRFALCTPSSATNSVYKHMFMGYGTPSDVGYLYGTPSITALNTNVWQHIVATAQGKKYSFYLNGLLVDSWTNGAPLNFDINNYMIGSEPTGLYSFQGAIDQVRIYKRVLSSNEVVSLYNLDRSLPTLVYSVSGSLSYSTSSTNSSQDYSGYFVYNHTSLKSAFIWLKSLNTYTLESMSDIDFHSTTPYVGGKSIYSVANADGTFPNVGKDIIWLGLM
jgi:hypothetical protein